MKRNQKHVSLSASVVLSSFFIHELSSLHFVVIIQWIMLSFIVVVAWCPSLLTCCGCIRCILYPRMVISGAWYHGCMKPCLLILASVAVEAINEVNKQLNEEDKEGNKDHGEWGGHYHHFFASLAHLAWWLQAAGGLAVWTLLLLLFLLWHYLQPSFWGWGSSMLKNGQSASQTWMQYHTQRLPAVAALGTKSIVDITNATTIHWHINVKAPK